MDARNNKLSGGRRKFLKTLSLAGILGFLLPKHFLKASTKAKSRVIIVEDTAATEPNWIIHSSVVDTMVQSGIKSLAQNNDIGEAWKTLLPGVNNSSIIAIKVNCSASLATNPEVTYAVANSLTQMMFGGTAFPANNIIIYESYSGGLTAAGYTLNSTSTGIRCMGTPSFSTEEYAVSDVSQKLSTIITTTANFLINIAVLKNADISGVTLCLKNHYGTCNHPIELHGGNYCDPYIPALNALTPIKSKQTVNIIDALFGIRSGGPGGSAQFTANKIIMSSDIVAADYCGKELLKSNGCLTTGNAYHIDTAATTYALGNNDPANMDIINITNSSGVEDGQNENTLPSETGLEQNYPNPFNPSTNIPYKIKKAGQVVLKVYDINGKEISTLVDGFHQAGTYNVKFYGHNLSSGVYVCRLQTADAIISRKIVFMK